MARQVWLLLLIGVGVALAGCGGDSATVPDSTAPVTPGGGAGGMGMATTTEQTWTDGTLILDLWDPSTKKLVWRGSSDQVLKGTPDKRSKQIDQAFAGMLKKWQKMRGK